MIMQSESICNYYMIIIAIIIFFKKIAALFGVNWIFCYI